tara:strand:+ start:208 stop:603 length:396 start_codon:yes stop_codon:yes gene_type:complete
MTDHNSDNHGALSGPAPEDANTPSDQQIADRFMNGLSAQRKADFAITWLKQALEAAQEYKFLSEHIIDDIVSAAERMREAEGADDLESLKWEIEGLLSDAEQDWGSSNSEADDAMSSLEEIDINDIEWPNW